MELDLDFIHVSCWDFTKQATYGGIEQPYTAWFSKRINGKLPLISTGGVWNAQEAKMLCEQGADLVGVARAGIAHPDWPTYLEDGENTPKRPPFSADELEKAARALSLWSTCGVGTGLLNRKRPCRDSNAGSWLRRPGDIHYTTRAPSADDFA